MPLIRYPTRRGPAGFTMMELLLVLVVVVGMGIVAWPSVQKAYESTNLKSAAGEVQAAFGRARVEAMSSGVAQAFRFEPNAPQYAIARVEDDTSAVEANSADPSNSTATTTLVQASFDGSNGSAATNCKQQALPEGIVFLSADRTSDTRTAAADSALEQSGQSTTAPAIMFYPDGTTSDASVTIGNTSNRCITITLRGLTGVSRRGEIFTGSGM